MTAIHDQDQAPVTGPGAQKLTEREITALREQAAGLTRQADEQARRLPLHRYHAEERARLLTLSAELAAAGRCGRYSERGDHDGDEYTSAFACVLAAGHEEPCNDSFGLVPARGMPSPEDREQEITRLREQAAELNARVRAAENASRAADQAAVTALTGDRARAILAELAAKPGAVLDAVRKAERERQLAEVPEPGTVITVTSTHYAPRDGTWKQVTETRDWTVAEGYPEDYPGRGVIVRVQDDGGETRHLLRSWQDPQDWFYICGRLTGARRPCRNGSSQDGGACGSHAGK